VLIQKREADDPPWSLYGRASPVTSGRPSRRWLRTAFGEITTPRHRQVCVPSPNATWRAFAGAKGIYRQESRIARAKSPFPPFSEWATNRTASPVLGVSTIRRTAEPVPIWSQDGGSAVPTGAR
jgi:hypothetical protein